MAYLPRGIAPELLLSQVKNTMPYLFLQKEVGDHFNGFPPAQVLRDFERQPADALLSHFEYFRLCVSCHYLTCGTPVPTDVDNQIRLKLWPEALPLETALEMARFVLESRKQDFTLVSTRFSFGSGEGPWKGEWISGHLGEWFTLSAAAYCALKRYNAPEALTLGDEILAAIADEVHRHSEVFGSLWRAGDGLGCLKAAASIAHNFGDLDRVMDMWDLSFADPLRLGFYKLAITPFDPDRRLRYLGRLWVAGELYKSPIEGSAMALENHRHFALRKPRSLRQDPKLLIPIGPFFDDWGVYVGECLKALDGAPSEATLEVVAALVHGRQRLPKTHGYLRALRGMRQIHPVLEIRELSDNPAMAWMIDLPTEEFERRWADAALLHMDDIPSRAE